MDYRDPDWVAERLGLDKNTVYKFLNDGTLPAVQLGRKWLISEARLRAWLEQQTDAQTRARRSVARLADRTVRRMDNFSPAGREVVRAALAEARRYVGGSLGPEHLLLGLVADDQTPLAKWLAEHGLSADVIRRQAEERTREAVEGGGPRVQRIRRTPIARRAMRLAIAEAGTRGARRVEPGHLLLGLLLAGEGTALEILSAAGVDELVIRQWLATQSANEQEKACETRKTSKRS